MIDIIKYVIVAAVSVISVIYSAVRMLLMCWVWCFMVAGVLAAGWQSVLINHSFIFITYYVALVAFCAVWGGVIGIDRNI